MLWNLPFITVVVLTLIGLVTVLLKKNIIKILMGINILELRGKPFYRGAWLPYRRCRPDLHACAIGADGAAYPAGTRADLDCDRGSHQCAGSLVCHGAAEKIRDGRYR